MSSNGDPPDEWAGAGHFVKVYQTILASSIWDESLETRIVWITMLVMADADGYVAASVGGLAHAARVTRDACEHALDVLSSPDPDSRTPDNEGRRIVRVRGGWHIPNHRQYRDLRTREQIATAERVKRWRDRQASQRAATGNADKRYVTPSNGTYGTEHTKTAEAEVEVEAEAEVEIRSDKSDQDQDPDSNRQRPARAPAREAAADTGPSVLDLGVRGHPDEKFVNRTDKLHAQEYVPDAFVLAKGERAGMSTRRIAEVLDIYRAKADPPVRSQFSHNRAFEKFLQTTQDDDTAGGHREGSGRRNGARGATTSGSRGGTRAPSVGVDRSGPDHLAGTRRSFGDAPPDDGDPK